MHGPFYKIFAKPVAAWKRALRGRSEKGQTLVEYAIVLCFISIMAIGVFSALGNRIIIVFSAIDTLLDTAQGSH